ncbi:MAG: hypothetical protein KU37_11515 [Sulfuricurvum sp. PC08-66]|nr:MAG: hypothetical protein KU37_11515 [Sulfuricurvum sp. PC08-66]
MTSKNGEGNQFLSFYLKDEMFAINVAYVREIIEYTHITRVPMMQNFVAGVTNIRGNVIPVLELAGRLGLKPSPVTKKSCIITLETHAEGEEIAIGLIVDMVDQVYDIHESHKLSAPEFGAKIRKEFMQMMTKVEDKFMTVLDLEGILKMSELSKVTFKHTL